MQLVELVCIYYLYILLCHYAYTDYSLLLYYYSVKGDDSNEFMSSVLEEMKQEQEKLIEEKQIIAG